jgi:hypothetical protein
MSEQLLFEFSFADGLPDETDIDETVSLRPIDIRRAILAWLFDSGVAGMATRTATRRAKYQADVAAFWNLTKRNRQKKGPTQLHTPCRTMIIECRSSREECWPDCSNSSELLPQLRQLKRCAVALEEEIRLHEPQLRESGTLFEEYSEWNYEKSQNADYKTLRHQIKALEESLYKGTRFESMRDAELADQLYLAVPENTVHPHELATGWGLLWVKDDLSIAPMSEAAEQGVSPEHRFHLVQNIATAASNDVMFTHGVHVADDTCHFLPVPRRRRKRRSKG